MYKKAGLHQSPDRARIIPGDSGSIKDGNRLRLVTMGIARTVPGIILALAKR